MILGQAQQFASPMEALSHVSETPWSTWTKADYTLEQWHAACLVHIHDGEPTSKSQCKLPVKTPDGALNRHGVHAAAAALAGARGGLKGVSAEQKNKAAAALRRYYAQLDEDPPESLAIHSIDFREKPGSPEEVLEHFGVKGMRWGVRKERAANLQSVAQGDITRTTKKGHQFTLSSKPPTKIHKALAVASKSYAENYANQAYLSIKDKDGKKIGTANFWNDKKDPTAVYLNWISINKGARGRGYATAVLQAAEEHSRAAGKKKMKLEVPGVSPDARHIYEKMGFKVTQESTKTDSVWGGLTHMEKKLD